MTCPHCNGRKTLPCPTLVLVGEMLLVCAVCVGTGKRRCLRCHGTGEIEEEILNEITQTKSDIVKQETL